MVSTYFTSALAAAALCRMALAQSTAPTPVPTPVKDTSPSELVARGCYKSPGSMIDFGPAGFQSQGNCQRVCASLNYPGMALVDGTNCWCGNELPPKDALVSDDECNTDCAGFDKQKCGGNRKWMVFQDGLNKNQLNNQDTKTIASSAASKTAAPPAQSKTQAPEQTVVVTQAPSSSAPAESSGPNKVGIAVGVVVGVIAVAAIIGGALFFMRQRKRKQAEEEYKRAAAINEFVGKPPGTSHSSITDSRLDPEVMMRRQSDGSIADNQDYSRRILQVRNA